MRFFHKASISDNILCRNVGHSPERPFVIKAALQETSLGDLVAKLVCLITIKQQFDHAELHLRYRDVRPYSKEAVALCPQIDHVEAIKGELPAWARLWLPDLRLWIPLARAIDGRKGSWASFCDFYPTDWMLNPRWLHAIASPAKLKIPQDKEKTLSAQLIEMGLEPKRWFAVLHYRASSYLGKRSGLLRNGDPKANLALVDHIIKELGGQVVMLGHPELEPFPARDSFIDLSRLKNSFLLQAFATSRARFMVAGPSGPINLGWGFQIPTALVDTVDGDGGWGPEAQLVLTKKITTPQGKIVQNLEADKAGLLDYRLLRDKIRAGEGYAVTPNSFEELRAVADHLHSKSSNVNAWRSPTSETEGPKPNQFVWPPQTNDNLHYFDIFQR